MKEKYGISVLMSVYKNEKAEFLKIAIDSMLVQSRKPDEIVIVEDGPLTDELYSVLLELEKEYPEIIKRYALSENMGLGLALRFGVKKCRFSLIARMDTDDISVKERLKLQEEAFLKDETLDIIGGQIEEFIDYPENIVSRRLVPIQHKDIIVYQKKRSAFNHVTVMFKKESVLRAGNYENSLYMEDDMLWLNMISSGCKTQNLVEVLCRVRVGDDMYMRRGGIKYLKQYFNARYAMTKRRQISLVEFLSSVLTQTVVTLLPTRIRKWIFVTLLRS